MNSNKYFIFECPDGKLSLPLELVANSPFITDTIMDKIVKSYKYNLRLLYEVNIIRYLFPLIRSGEIACELPNYHQQELYDLVDYIMVKDVKSIDNNLSDQINNQYFEIECPDGTVFLPLDILINNKFINNTLIYKMIKPDHFNPQYNLKLMYEIGVVRYLFPLIRSGKIINDMTPYYRQELMSLIKYLSGDNKDWLKITDIINFGKIDDFGLVKYDIARFEDIPATESCRSNLTNSVKRCIDKWFNEDGNKVIQSYTSIDDVLDIDEENSEYGNYIVINKKFKIYGFTKNTTHNLTIHVTKRGGKLVVNKYFWSDKTSHIYNKYC